MDNKTFKVKMLVVFAITAITLQLGIFSIQAFAQEADAPTEAVEAATEPAVEPAPATEGVEAMPATEGVEATPAIEETALAAEEAAPTEEPASDGVEAGLNYCPVNPEITTAAASEPAPAPVLTTDKADYAPTEKVTIFGRLFQALQNLILRIVGGFPDGSQQVTHEDTVTTDDQGAFTYEYQLDGTYRPDYTVTASSEAGEELARTTFTDPPAGFNPSVSIDQCANGGIGNTPESCATKPPLSNATYQSGNVNGQKAHWQEGDVLPYRAVLKDLAAGINRVTFSFDTAKGSEMKHAIDYLASFDYTETTGPATPNHANQNNPCADTIVGCNPAAPTATANINVPSYFTTGYPIACANGAWAGGNPIANQQIKAWGNIDSSMILTYPDGGIPTSGDCSPRFTIEFNVTVAHSDVVIAWGGHVAANQDPGAGGYWGTGNAVPTGSPYHMHAGFPQESPSGTFYQVGNQDLQLASSAISAPGSIVIIKNTVGGDNTFNYTATGGGITSPFSITTSGGANSVTFGSLATGAAGGSRSITENTQPSGWGFTSLSCQVTVAGDGTTAYSITGPTVNVTNLGGGASLTCTYTNTLQTGHVIIVKDAIPNDAQNFAFANNFGNGNPASFNLDDDADGTLSNSRDSEVLAGTYAVSETVPSGWDLTSATCDHGTIGAIQVLAGQTTTCTFTNTKRGSITIIKNTIGGDGTFNYTSNFGVSSLTTSGGTASQTVNDLVPGSGYSISETVPAGWDLTSATCDHGTIGAIQVLAGQTTTCTFTNTKRGHIIVDKVTDPSGDPQSFAFTTTGSGYNGFSLTDAAAPNNQEVAPGAYSVAESVPAGWDLTSATCDMGETPASLDVEPGETVTCTFTNQKDAIIIIEKQTLPDGDSQVFDFDLSYGDGDADLSDGQTDNSGDLDPGTYSAWENVPAGWDFTSAVCSDQSPVGAISLQAGETVTCVFTNTKRGHIIVDKVTIGGDATFSFDASGGTDPAYANFTLTGAQTPNNQELKPGSYSVSEGALAGWDLTNTVCVSSIGDTETAGSLELDAGETVTYTFTNTKKPTLTVNKVLVPSSDNGLFNLQIDSSTAGTGANVGDGGTTGAVEVTIGAHTVGETAGTGTDLSHYVTVISGDCAADGTVSLAAGENKTCTITNTRKGSITIKKVTVGGDASFTFTGDVAGSLSNNQTATAQVVPGTYHSTETVLTGWDLTNITCNDSDSSGVISTGVATFNVAAGEDVTCTFINTKRGHIIVDKITDPTGDPQSFDFTTTGSGYAGFSLTDVAAPNNQEVVPGAYTVAETPLAGGDLTSATCDKDETPASLDVEPGETVTCTFNNQKDAFIIVDKVTDPSGDPTLFDFTTSYGSPFTLADATAPNNSGDLA
ncbi:MAG: hypothetical protein V1892_03755, partial [bacterium]